jgi:hypothetical protein
VQFGHDDFGGATLGFVLVVPLDACRDAATVIGYRDRIIGVDGDDDLVAMTGQRLVDRVVDNLEDQVMKPVPSEVSPIYIPGRLRTASSPSSIWMELES